MISATSPVPVSRWGHVKNVAVVPTVPYISAVGATCSHFNSQLPFQFPSPSLLLCLSPGAVMTTRPSQRHLFINVWLVDKLAAKSVGCCPYSFRPALCTSLCSSNLKQACSVAVKHPVQHSLTILYNSIYIYNDQKQQTWRIKLSWGHSSLGWCLGHSTRQILIVLGYPTVDWLYWVVVLLRHLAST